MPSALLSESATKTVVYIQPLTVHFKVD